MSKMTTCKVCGKEIASNAKVCVSCGAKVKKPLYKKWWFWVLVVIIVSSIGFSGGNENSSSSKSSDKSSNKSSTAVTKQETKMYSIGETVTGNKFEITVTNASEKISVGNQYLSSTPSDGGIYIAVEWEYKNISDKPISSFSCPKVYIKDSNGTKYDSDISASSYYATEIDRDAKILSDLNPGIKVKDAKVFEISKEQYDAGGFVLVVDADNNYEYKLN